MIQVIACSIFKPYIEQLNIHQQYILTYLPIQQHNQPKILAQAIQQKIDQTKNVDKIIVLYGVCGGALLKIHAREIPVIVIKVHDCMSILLGSKEKYNDLTKDNASISWSCYSLKKDHYMNDEMTKWNLLYDEETVTYLKSMLILEEPIYISFGLPQESEYLKNEKKIILGDLTFLHDILLLKSAEILVLYKNQKIEQSIQDVIKIVKL